MGEDCLQVGLACGKPYGKNENAHAVIQAISGVGLAASEVGAVVPLIETSTRSALPTRRRSDDSCAIGGGFESGNPHSKLQRPANLPTPELDLR